MSREGRLQRSACSLIRAEGGHVVVLGPMNGTGEPELTGTIAGWSFAIELKKPGEVPTAIQRATLRLWSLAGAVTAVADNLSTVRWAIDECRRRAGDASPGSPRRVVASPDTEQERLA